MVKRFCDYCGREISKIAPYVTVTVATTDDDTKEKTQLKKFDMCFDCYRNREENEKDPY